METKKQDGDTIIITYSRDNCNKTNESIQDRIDAEAGREIPERRSDIQFYAGDRCCIERPIEVCEVHRMVKKSVDYAYLGQPTSDTLYNGEIFDIVFVEPVRIITPLNKFKYMDKYFDGQILTIKRPTDEKRYEILNIPKSAMEDAKKKVRENERRMFYLSIFTAFMKHYPTLTYGYCITIYKSQGSEWKNVFVNMNSIRWSIVGSKNNVDIEKKKALFKATYTALTRATHNIYMFWK
jgi:hypothetical protein